MISRLLVATLAYSVLPLPAQAEQEPRSTTPLAPGLSFQDHKTIASPKDFLLDYETRAGEGLIHAVVEIPAGTNEKWEVGPDGVMRWDMKDGRVRTVAYLGYPGNYGLVPRTVLPEEIGGDGDPLDVVVLGPSVPRGSVVPVRAIGVIRLVDGGETDDKILAVPVGAPLGEVTDLEQLDSRFPGITGILKTWFENYKGPGKLQCGGFAGREEAERLIESSARAFSGESRRK